MIFHVFPESHLINVAIGTQIQLTLVLQRVYALVVYHSTLYSTRCWKRRAVNRSYTVYRKGRYRWLCSRLIAGIAGSSTAEGMDFRLLFFLCVVLTIYVTNWSLVERSSTGCVCVCVCVT